MIALVGFGAGGNLPVDGTMFLEFIPGNKQYLLTFLSIWWAIGQVIASLIAVSQGHTDRPRSLLLADIRSGSSLPTMDVSDVSAFGGQTQSQTWSFSRSRLRVRFLGFGLGLISVSDQD